jgi:hypothetical protein
VLRYHQSQIFSSPSKQKLKRNRPQPKNINQAREGLEPSQNRGRLRSAPPALQPNTRDVSTPPPPSLSSPTPDRVLKKNLFPELQAGQRRRHPHAAAPQARLPSTTASLACALRCPRAQRTRRPRVNARGNEPAAADLSPAGPRSAAEAARTPGRARWSGAISAVRPRSALATRGAQVSRRALQFHYSFPTSTNILPAAPFVSRASGSAASARRTSLLTDLRACSWCPAVVPSC